MIVKEKKRVQVRIGKDLAGDTEAVLSELDLNPTMVTNMLCRWIVTDGALPFNTSLSKKERANLRSLEATEGAPITESKDAKEVADWLNDPDED